MTRQEDILTLTEHLEHWKRLLSEKICDQSEGEKTIDALQNAIKALEQEPCEDCMIDWITEENPEYADVYLVTWKHPLWDKTAFIGLCEWDGERWLVEDMEQTKIYNNATLIILAWANPEPYMGWRDAK